VRQGAIRLDQSQSEELLLRKLAAGRVSAALVNLNESKSLAYVLARTRVTRGVQRRGRVGKLDSFIGFSAKHARGPWARDRFDEGMRRIAANGVLADITRRWNDTTAATIRASRSAVPSRRP
jgi:ABC-type amino acid transport substrate-binding protein